MAAIAKQTDSLLLFEVAVDRLADQALLAEIVISRKEDAFGIQLAEKLVEEALREKKDIDQLLLEIAAESGKMNMFAFTQPSSLPIKR